MMAWSTGAIEDHNVMDATQRVSYESVQSEFQFLPPCNIFEYRDIFLVVIKIPFYICQKSIIIIALYIE